MIWISKDRCWWGGSYGAFIISDYINAYGENATARINYVAEALMLNENLDNVGPGFIDNLEGATTQDLPANLFAMRRFIQACPAEPMSEKN